MPLHKRLIVDQRSDQHGAKGTFARKGGRACDGLGVLREQGRLGGGVAETPNRAPRTPAHLRGAPDSRRL